jgi:hypothetical protein
MGPILIEGHKCPVCANRAGSKIRPVCESKKLSINLSVGESGNADLQNKFIGYSACENLPPPLL